MVSLTNVFRIGLLSVVLATGFAGEAVAQARRKIVFANDCRRPVQLMVYHADAYRNWHPHGWYKFDAYETYSYIRSSGVILTQLEDHNLYFYAETTDGGSILRWQGSGPEVTYQGGTYRTTNANTFVNSDGDIAIRLTCP